MAPSHRFAFDPNTPAARRLLRTARAAEPVEIELLAGLFVSADRAYGPGERLSLPRTLAEQAINKGFARRFASPSQPPGEWKRATEIATRFEPLGVTRTRHGL